jgi:hypothetical protein
MQLQIITSMIGFLMHCPTDCSNGWRLVVVDGDKELGFRVSAQHMTAGASNGNLTVNSLQSNSFESLSYRPHTDPLRFSALIS